MGYVAGLYMHIFWEKKHCKGLSRLYSSQFRL